jgi:hypothetical protein
VAKLLLIGVLVLSSFLLLACNEMSQEEVAIQISRSEELQKLDRLCGSIPIPENTKVDRKYVYEKRGLRSIAYYYDYGTKIREAKDLASKWLGDNNWVLTQGQNEFSKGNLDITIESGDRWGKNHSIVCTEVSDY